MTAHLACYGRLGGDPRAIETRTGKPMAAATMAVDLDESPSGPPLWLGIVAFGAAAETLLGHGKGDLLSVSGTLRRRAYTGREGEAREQLQVVAEAIVSARTVRPGGGRKRTRRRPEHLGELIP